MCKYPFEEEEKKAAQENKWSKKWIQEIRESVPVMIVFFSDCSSIDMMENNIFWNKIEKKVFKILLRQISNSQYKESAEISVPNWVDISEFEAQLFLSDRSSRPPTAKYGSPSILTMIYNEVICCYKGRIIDYATQRFGLPRVWRPV